MCDAFYVTDMSYLEKEKGYHTQRYMETHGTYPYIFVSYATHYLKTRMRAVREVSLAFVALPAMHNTQHINCTYESTFRFEHRAEDEETK